MMPRSPLHTLPALLLALLLGGTAAAQETGQRRDEAPRPIDLLPAAPEVDDPRDVRRPRSRFVLDAPVRRDGYLLGPGDVLELALVGDVNRVITVPVTPEGTVVVPGMGITSVLELNLDEAQARVQQLVARYLRNTRAYLTLSEVRTFKVYVVGGTPEPGARAATSTTRVSEVVPPDAGRNVELQRSNGDHLHIDLRRFRQIGDLDANPLLREGDRIVVPVADEPMEVYGRVRFPGRYGHRPGETLAELLWLANGGFGFPVDAADTIRVTRFVDRQRREVVLFSRDEATGDAGHAFALRPFDAVYVPAVSNYMLQQVATVAGQVVHPGVYPIEPGITSACDLVAQAGGFTPEASLVGAVLRRPREAADVQPAWRALDNVPPEYLSDRDRRIMRVRAQGDETNVVIDFEAIYGNGAACRQTLESGDVLTVPKQRDEVVVLGAVRRPGVVRYVPGMRVGEVVGMAGGFTRRADRRDVTVLTAKLGTRVDAREVAFLEPGDMVVVPFRERRTWQETLQLTSSIATSIAGLVLIAQTIF